MNIAFILTMPNVGSWNGRWSGENNLYAVVRKVSTITGQRITGRRFHYSWSDGWGANVECREVKGNDIRKLRKASKGFYGYEWMIDSILERDCIKASHELQPETV